MRWTSSAAGTVLIGNIGLAAATLNLSDLQPVSGFSATCLATYNTPIPDCPSASNFISPSGPPCTQACFLALISAGAAIQSACQYQAANSGTVIGQAFAGTLGLWLCNGENTGKGNAASSLTASIVIIPTPTASTTSIISRSGIHTTATSTVTTTMISPSASSSPSTSSSSSLPPSTSTTQTTLTTSTASPSTHSTSVSTQSSSSHTYTTSSRTSHTSTRSTSTAAKPASTIDDSTPFAQSMPMANSAGTLLPTSTMYRLVLGLLVGLGSIQALNAI